MHTHLIQPPRLSNSRGSVPFRSLILPLVLAVLVSATGCKTTFRDYVKNGFKVGPNYCPPSVEVAEHWIDYADPRVKEHPVSDWAWWRMFNDPVLEDLIQRTYQQNITLGEAGYRIEEARALRAAAFGNMFPQSQIARGGYNRQMLSFGTNFVAGGGGGIPGISRYFSVWSMQTQLAWELDFWGRYRRAIESADASLDATIEDYDSVLVMLIGEVAATYVEVRTVEQRLEYARANVGSQKGSLDVAEKKLEQGLSSRLDVTQAITNVAQTEAQIPVLETQLRQAENRLCVLMGMPPENLRPMMEQGKGIPVAPSEVAVGIPAELLRRRPDVRRAEREIAAQSARIGIAEADLYPAFSIIGQVGPQANTFQDLFRGQSIGGGFGPSFSWKILNYGRIKSFVAAEEARYMQEVLQYQNTVLVANREVEDGLARFLRAQEQAKALKLAADAAAESRTLVNILYEEGRADFNRVFVAELSLQQQQDELARAEGEIAQGLVAIFRALGGGWELRLEEVEDSEINGVIRVVEPSTAMPGVRPLPGAAPQPAPPAPVTPPPAPAP